MVMGAKEGSSWSLGVTREKGDCVVWMSSGARSVG